MSKPSRYRNFLSRTDAPLWFFIIGVLVAPLACALLAWILREHLR